MVFKCVECGFSKAKSYEVRRHYYAKHLQPEARPLTCRYSSCDWYGVSDRDYNQHRDSQKHQLNYQKTPPDGPDRPVQNEKWEPVKDEIIEVEDRENPKRKSEEEVTERKKLKADKKKEEAARGKETREKAPIFDVPSTPGTPVQDERRISSIIHQFQPTEESPDIRRITSQSPMITQLPRTPSVNTPPPIPRRLFDTPIKAAPEVSDKICSPFHFTSPSLHHDEFERLRADNSHHAVITQNALKGIERRLIEQNALLKEMTKPDRPEFQDRMEIAATSAQLLHQLGKRHDHGKGYSAACKTCKKGNELMMYMIGMTDKKLIQPFQPTFF